MRANQAAVLSVRMLRAAPRTDMHACIVPRHPALRLRGVPHAARFSTPPQASPAPGAKPPAGSISVRAGAVFAALSALAVALTTYGIWDYFASFRVWPKELREPLRAALKARIRGNLERSAKSFRTALEVARTIDPERLGADPLLKTTGIAIALAGVLEEENKWQDAALVYVDALEEVLQQGAHSSDAPRALTRAETMRAIVLAQKVGELAQRADVVVPPFPHPDTRTAEPAEGYMVWSVESLLRLLRAAEQPDTDTDTAAPAALSELGLPPWTTPQDLGASVEALGALYAKHDLVEYAVPLYLQALAVLLPTSAGAGGEQRAPPTVADRCRAAILMNNISQVLAQAPRPGGADASPLTPVQQAMAWAAKGLDLVTLTSHRAGFLADLPEEDQASLLRTAGHDRDRVGPIAPVVETSTEGRLAQVRQQCLGAQFVLLYNLGMFHQMQDDSATARKLFVRAKKLADRLDMREARTQCARALARLDRK
ncbi:hypothetical protein MSPP1_000490 [Malassezia sp. CBS 17886]|nr:hypothetical protein MSPP1_000490 [Malassezia sp. CBS 17886]